MFEREKHVAYNANAYAAGRVLGVDPVEQISKRCIRIVKMSEPDVSACVLCRWIILCLLMHNKFVIVLWKSFGWLCGLWTSSLCFVFTCLSCLTNFSWMDATLFYLLFNFFVVFIIFYILCLHLCSLVFFFSFSSDAITSASQPLVLELFCYVTKCDICSSCPEMLVHVYMHCKFLSAQYLCFLKIPSNCVISFFFSVRKNITWAV